MIEPILYVSTNVHLGQLRAVGSELAYQQLRIVEDLQARAAQENPALSPLPNALLTRTIVGSFALSDRRKSQWRKAKGRFDSLLWEANFLGNPGRLDLQLSENLGLARQLRRVDEVSGFLTLAARRINFLMSDEAQKRLYSKVWTALVYAEDYALRKAVFDGKFFYGEVRLGSN